MHFADLKNDFVFRRIFAKHPDLLCTLLNDLLERSGDERIVAIEYLPSEQLPMVAGAKLSILDVRCRDVRGTTFVVEMQLLHVAGFMNRVVYNACKAYVEQLRSGQSYSQLKDVVAISICDFALWPHEERDAQGQPRIPMLSHWTVRERASNTHDLLQVQYVFLELPKLTATTQPTHGAELWAWLFVHAPELTEPPDLPPGPYREAVELASEAGFTSLELDAYRKVMDEIQQARDYGDARHAEGRSEGRAEGRSEGFVEGEIAALHRALLAILAARQIEFDSEVIARVQSCKSRTLLDQWLARAATASSADEIFSI